MLKLGFWDWIGVGQVETGVSMWITGEKCSRILPLKVWFRHQHLIITCTISSPIPDLLNKNLIFNMIPLFFMGILTSESIGTRGLHRAKEKRIEIWTCSRNSKKLRQPRTSQGQRQMELERQIPHQYHICMEGKTLLNSRPFAWDIQACPIAAETQTMVKSGVLAVWPWHLSHLRELTSVCISSSRPGSIRAESAVHVCPHHRAALMKVHTDQSIRPASINPNCPVGIPCQ